MTAHAVFPAIRVLVHRALRVWRTLFVSPSTGNLLQADVLAEVTLHVLSNGQFKSIASKVEDGPDNRIHRMLMEALVRSATDLGLQRGVGLNWLALNKGYPYMGPMPCDKCGQGIAADEIAVVTVRPPVVLHPGCAGPPARPSAPSAPCSPPTPDCGARKGVE